MVEWKNLDSLASFQALLDSDCVDLAAVMSGDNGADRAQPAAHHRSGRHGDHQEKHLSDPDVHETQQPKNNRGLPGQRHHRAGCRHCPEAVPEVPRSTADRR